MAEISDRVEEIAAGPKTVQVDGMTVTQFDPTEVAEALKEAEKEAAVKKKHRGLYFTKLVPPGAS